MWEFMREINAAGVTIILTTHYLEEAESLCRNIAIIEGGRIIENDTMMNVIRKLQREVFVLTLIDSINEPPDLPGYPVSIRNEHEIEVEVSKDRGLNDLFKALSEKSLRVSSMRTKTNRLEELFMRMVDDKRAGVEHVQQA